MKFNWGTGIVLAFTAFISFIMYFVITMSVDKTYEHDLVTENYYGQELEFQNDINREVYSQSLKQDIIWRKNPEGIIIEFPENFEVKDIKGKVFMYRPSNKQLDFVKKISLSNHSLLVADERLLDGRWNIRVEWYVGENAYLYKKEIIY